MKFTEDKWGLNSDRSKGRLRRIKVELRDLAVCALICNRCRWGGGYHETCRFAYWTIYDKADCTMIHPMKPIA